MSRYNRGKKNIFPQSEQKRILEHFRQYVNTHILPDENINSISLTGSLINGEFGKYEKYQKFPLYKRLYSDIDLMMLVNDKFKPKTYWKPMVKQDNYSTYKITSFEKKFPVICWIVNSKKLNKLEKRYHPKKSDMWLYK